MKDYTIMKLEDELDPILVFDEDGNPTFIEQIITGMYYDIIEVPIIGSSYIEKIPGLKHYEIEYRTRSGEIVNSVGSPFIEMRTGKIYKRP